jgi:predicted nucleic acid-binding Zn ribbon protein
MPGNGRVRRFLRRIFRTTAPEAAGPQGEPPAPAEVRVEALVSSQAPNETPGTIGQAPAAQFPAPAPQPAVSNSASLAAGASERPAEAHTAINAETAERLARLPKALADLAEAVQSQNQINDRLREVLAALREPDQEFLHAVHDVSAEGRKQTDLLQNLCGLLSERRQLDNLAAGAMVRLPALLDDLHKSNASLVEMMEQTRERWASTNEDLAKEMVRQRRRTTALMVGIFALLAVQTVLLVVRLFTGK